MFCYFVNSRFLHYYIQMMKFLGFNSFWINVFLWLPVQLALLELKLKYGSLENYLRQCDDKRSRRDEPAA